MKPFMKLDDFGHNTIRNIYFDTTDYRLIRRSLEKPAYKEKLRIRSYKAVQPGDYTDVFGPILKDYTTECELAQVKTTNMGSLFRLTYDLTMQDVRKEKELINKLRCRNGNLEITISNQQTATGEL